MIYYLFDSYWNFFVKDWRDGSSTHSLTKSLVSNESIKSDSIQILIKNYLSFYRTEVHSVWLNIMLIIGHQRQADWFSANSKETVQILSFSSRSVLFIPAESITKGTSSLRQTGLEIVSQLLCVVNCKQCDYHPLTSLMELSMIDSSVSWFSYH